MRTAFLAWINAQPKEVLDGYVEDFDTIADALRRGMAQHSAEDLAKYAGRVDSVQFEDADHAAVRYSVLFDGVAQYARQQGRAVKVDGTWMVSRDTVCALLALGGIACPPRPGDPVPLVPVPDVVGMPRAAAELSIGNVGCSVRVSFQAAAGEQQGTVLRQSPTPNELVPCAGDVFIEITVGT